MKKLLFVLALLATPVAAQTTTVTATVTDRAGVPYSLGNYDINLTNNTGQTAYFQGAPLPQSLKRVTGRLNASGSLNVTLPSSNFISSGLGGPVNTTTWNFSITASDGGS